MQDSQADPPLFFWQLLKTPLDVLISKGRRFPGFFYSEVIILCACMSMVGTERRPVEEAYFEKKREKGGDTSAYASMIAAYGRSDSF